MGMNGKVLRVLVAEGDAREGSTALRALFSEVGKSLELTAVSSIAILIATLEIVNPEVILLDLSLAHPEPMEVVRRIHRSAPAVPLIVFTDVADKSYAAESLGHGALDYLLKGYMDPETLDRVLHTALEFNTLDGLADLLRDPLTELYIRDGFLPLGARAMEAARRNSSTLVLLCIRIENLPALREEHGPSAAESTLREVAALMRGSFRRTDILCRLGESQFAALAVDAAEPSAAVLLQRLEKRIVALNQGAEPRGPLTLRMSAGVWTAKDTTSFSEFLDVVEAGLRLRTEAAAQEKELAGAGIRIRVREI